MNNEQKIDIVMFNMSSFREWEPLSAGGKGRANRNFHILNNLSRNPRIGKILAVDFLPFTYKRAARNYWENIIGGPKGKVIYRDLTSMCVEINSRFITDNLRLAQTGSPLSTPHSPLFVYSTIDSVFSEKSAVRKIKKIIEKLEFKNTVIWSYFPMFADYFNIESRLNIFDTVDNWSVHPNFVKYKNRLEDNYKSISQKADLIFTVSENLVDWFKSLGRKKDVYFIPNGIDVEHFQQELRVTSYKLQDIKHPIIGYMGVIQSRIDMGLIKYLAEKNPDKSIVLVGQVWPDSRKESVENLKNVYFLGYKPYEEAPFYFNHFDVGIIPHVINEFTRSMNPLKLYEYLACGKPVVTTPVAGIESFKDLVYVAENYEEFNRKIGEALKDDNEDLRQKRQAAVREHSWEKRVEKMLDLVWEKL